MASSESKKPSKTSSPVADQVPDPARSYERAKPEAESGMGRMDNNNSTPTNRPDNLEKSVSNRQPPRQINADDSAQPAKKAPDKKK